MCPQMKLQKKAGFIIYSLLHALHTAPFEGFSQFSINAEEETIFTLGGKSYHTPSFMCRLHSTNHTQVTSKKQENLNLTCCFYNYVKEILIY